MQRSLTLAPNTLYNKSGMSEIRNKGHPGPVKSRPIQFTGFPVLGKKFHLIPFKPQVRFFNDTERYSSETFSNLSTVW
jgi:hypothetical protein